MSIVTGRPATLEIVRSAAPVHFFVSGCPWCVADKNLRERTNLHRLTVNWKAYFVGKGQVTACRLLLLKGAELEKATLGVASNYLFRRLVVILRALLFELTEKLLVIQ